MFTVTLSGPTTEESCGTIPNTASVAAANEPAGPDYTGNNEASASITVQCASITLVKTAGDAADDTTLLLEEPGDVTFTYLVTNTGTADLTDVMLVDDNATPDDTSDDITVICPDIDLAAGDSMTCTATLPVGYGQRTNIATVTATPVLEPEGEVTATDDAVVNVPEPEVTPTPTPDGNAEDHASVNVHHRRPDAGNDRQRPAPGARSARRLHPRGRLPRPVEARAHRRGRRG